MPENRFKVSINGCSARRNGAKESSDAPFSETLNRF